jgi:hypothetical protein
MGVDMLIIPATNASQMQCPANDLMQAIVTIRRKLTSSA